MACQPLNAMVEALVEHLCSLSLDAQHRERLLWASGGLVDVAKCLCCILLWSFDSKGRATMVDMADMIPKLTVTKGNNFIPVLRA